MNLNTQQKNIDELFARVIEDNDLIDTLSKEHGHCIRLYTCKEYDKWLFEDRFEYKIDKVASN